MSVYNVDIASGELPMVTNGVLRGCGKDIPIGPLSGYATERGVVKLLPESNHTVVIFEIASDARGLPIISDKRLKAKAIEAVEIELQKYVNLLKRDSGADVWCVYRQRLQCLHSDGYSLSGARRGRTAFIELGMFATSLCLCVTDEKPINGVTG